MKIDQHKHPDSTPSLAKTLSGLAVMLTICYDCFH